MNERNSVNFLKSIRYQILHIPFQFIKWIAMNCLTRNCNLLINCSIK